MRSKLAGMLVLGSLIPVWSCGSDSSNGSDGNTGGSGGTGATSESGGASTVGGMVGAGGTMATGGAMATGGMTVTGGAPATGGVTATGGIGTGTGGTTTTTGGMGPSTGGTGANTGGTGPGPDASCDVVTPCGGDVEATWTASSSCLTFEGSVNVSLLGLGCSTATVSGSVDVTGQMSFNSDGTYTDTTSWVGTEDMVLEATCLEISGTVTNCGRIGPAIRSNLFRAQGLAASEVDCVSDETTGGCNCAVAFDQVNEASGTYTLAGNVITTDAGAEYSYCVDGSALTMTPNKLKEDTATVQTGTVVFVNGAGGGTGTGGSGGAGGTEGNTGGTEGNTGGTEGNTGGTTEGGTAGSAGGTEVTTGGTAGSAGSGEGGQGAGGSTSVGERPCDIYEDAGNSCVAAYSMIRRLSSSYTGPLYQVRAGSNPQNTGTGGTTHDIGQTDDGFGDAAAQDAVCNNTTCTISILYDQSGNGNDIIVGTRGNSAGGEWADDDDFETIADAGPLRVGGRNVYSLYMDTRQGYRSPVNSGPGNNMPVGAEPQGIYMLADGTHYGSACCWDFGNVTDTPADGWHFMDTLFFGTAYWGTGAGEGPWFGNDMEAGVWMGGSRRGDPGWGALEEPAPPNNNNPSLPVPFALGFTKTSTSSWGLRVADLQTANNLTNAYEGPLPEGKTLDHQGAVVLGVGGDNSNNSWGTFYEGAIVAGYPDDSTEDAILQNLKDVGYGR